MAKLEVLPEQHIIDGFKKVIDFYVYMGIPCARKWPRSPGHKRTPAVEKQWIPFSYINTIAATLPEEIIQAYQEMAAGTQYHWKDYLTKAYISGIEDIAALNPIPEIPPITEYFTITNIEQHRLPTGWKTVLTTNVACTMLMFWTDREPRKYFRYRRRRGVSILAMANFGFVYTRRLWQREPTDSDKHTFYFLAMEEDETRYFATIAWKHHWLMKSTSPIFHKTREHPWLWPIIDESWDNPYDLPPHMDFVIIERWQPTEPPTYALVLTEPWHPPSEEPPILIKVFTEPWSLFTDPPPMVLLATEFWDNPYSEPPVMIRFIIEEWTQ